MRAVPAAQSLAGTVAGHLHEIRVLAALARTAEHLPLPLGVRGSCAAVRGGFHQIAPEFIGSGLLHLQAGLVHAGNKCTPHCDLERINVPARIGDRADTLLCKVLDGAPDRRVRVKRAARHLQIGAVERVLKLPCGRVGGRLGEVLKQSVRLLQTGVQYLLHRRREFRLAHQTGSLIDLLVSRERFHACLLHDGGNLLAALAGQAGQLGNDVLAECAHLLEPLHLVLRGRNEQVKAVDAPRHVGENVRLGLCVQLNYAVRQPLEVFRREHLLIPPRTAAAMLRA